MEEQNDKNNQEKQYQALVDFFKKDIEIKTTLINIVPKSTDEYNEESRLEYLDKIFSELKNIENQFNEIIKNFNIENKLKDSFKTYFDKIKKEISELGYGSNHKKLQEIYQKIFTDMKPELLEKTKEIFRGYASENGGLEEIPNIINEVGSINELLHVTHSSIVNDDILLESMPIKESKKIRKDVI